MYKSNEAHAEQLWTKSNFRGDYFNLDQKRGSRDYSIAVDPSSGASIKLIGRKDERFLGQHPT